MERNSSERKWERGKKKIQNVISNETRDLFFIWRGHVIYLIASLSGVLCYLLAKTYES